MNNNKLPIGGGGNKQLHKAKKGKNDEFYTQLTDIEKELYHYDSFFRGKTVFCNCDDPRVSNFFRYFTLKFHVLGLNRLISTCYMNENPDLFSQGASVKRSIYSDFDGSFECNELTDFNRIPYKQLHGDGTYCAGDFRSAECIELLKQADIVVTNPPFSLFREYVAQLIAYDKKFLIIGNKNAITYKEIFPLIKENRIWVGFQPMSVDMLFDIPKEQQEELLKNSKNGSKYRIVNGVVKGRSASIWFTNIEHSKRHEELPLYKRYNPEEYPKYDNYDAINVDKVNEIPCDYYGVMGVPITFLDKYNPEQFEIVEFRKGIDGKDLIYSIGRGRFTLTSEYSSVDADSWANEQSERYGSGWVEQVRKNSHSTTAIAGVIKNEEGKIGDRIVYARVLIRKIQH